MSDNSGLDMKKFAEQLGRFAFPEPMSGCWIWTGMLSGGGYGRLKNGGKTWLAHRLSWELHNARPIPVGLFACHRCDNRMCVNPDHIYAGTPQENAADAARRGRMHKWRGTRSGDGNPKSKLRSADVADVRRRLLANESCASIARIYGVSRRAIYDILSERTWRS